MDTLLEEPWTAMFRNVLGPHGYVRITGERLQGTVTSIFVRQQHLPHFRDIYTAVTRTGLGGFWVSWNYIVVDLFRHLRLCLNCFFYILFMIY